MSGMYWGLTAMYLLDRLKDMDEEAIVSWVLRCQHPNGGFGGSERNDPHMLYTLSAVQILALFDKLDLIDADKVTQCKHAVGGVAVGTCHVGFWFFACWNAPVCAPSLTHT